MKHNLFLSCGSQLISKWYRGGNLSETNITQISADKNYSLTMKINHHEGYIHHE
jgi:hypothetical protein